MMGHGLRLFCVLGLLSLGLPALDAHASDGPAKIPAPIVDTAEFAVPNRKGLAAGFGPLQVNMGILLPAPSLFEGDEATAYRLRRSIERMGRMAEPPATWDHLKEASFRLDRHLSEPKLADGAAYTFESDYLTDPDESVKFLIRLTPPPGTGRLLWAVRADIAKVTVLTREGDMSAGGKPQDIPFAFTPKGSGNIPFTVSVAVLGTEHADPALAQQVEVTVIDSNPGHGGPIVASRAFSASYRIVRPPMAPPVVISAPSVQPVGKKGKDKDKEKKDEKGKDGGKKEEKKGGH